MILGAASYVVAGLTACAAASTGGWLAVALWVWCGVLVVFGASMWTRG